MNTYNRILSNRSDMTDWLIHFTRNNENGLSAREILRDILLEGVLRPGFSVRTKGNTIYGLEPAVCFSEQPISFFKSSLKARREPERMAGFGLLIHKQAIFKVGGLPVIYGLKNPQELQIGELEYKSGYRIINPDTIPKSLQYRYVAFNPDPNPLYGSMIDWSHEREWRWKSDTRDGSERPHPWKPLEIFRLVAFGPRTTYINPVCVFVEKNFDIAWMQNEIITGLLPLISEDTINPDYYANFMEGLIRTKIVSLESLKDCPRFEEVNDDLKLSLITDEDVNKLPEWWHKKRKIKKN